MNEKQTQYQYLSFTGMVELGPSHAVVQIAEGYMVDDALAEREARDWNEAEREAVEAFALSLIDGFDTEVARSDGYLRRSLTPCALGAGDEFIYVVRVPGQWCEWAVVTPECADEIRNAFF